MFFLIIINVFSQENICSLYPQKMKLAINACIFIRKCVLGERGVGASGMKKRRRDEEIMRRYQRGESTKELALSFGVNKRTIQRALLTKPKK